MLGEQNLTRNELRRKKKKVCYQRKTEATTCPRFMSPQQIVP